MRRGLGTVTGVLSAVAGALTVSAAAVLFFLLPVALPIGLAQALAGIKLLAGKQGWWAIVTLGGLLALPLSMSLLNGIAAPIALAASAASLGAILSSIAFRLTEPVSS